MLLGLFFLLQKYINSIINVVLENIAYICSWQMSELTSSRYSINLQTDVASLLLERAR